MDEPEENSWEADEREEETTAESLTEREEEAIAELFEEREEETTVELFEESGESPRKLFSKWKRACRTKRYREEIGRQRNAWIKGWWKWKRR